MNYEELVKSRKNIGDMTKEDYDRNVEQLLLDKCKAELEIERLNNIINELEKYINEAIGIERLNNIINELEKYINETKLEEFEKEYGRRYGKTFTQAEVIICNMILNKLQELKGSDKE